MGQCVKLGSCSKNEESHIMPKGARLSNFASKSTTYEEVKREPLPSHLKEKKKGKGFLTLPVENMGLTRAVPGIQKRRSESCEMLTLSIAVTASDIENILFLLIALSIC